MTSAGVQRVMVAVRVRPMLREGARMQAQEKFELQAAYRTGDTALRVELTKPGEPAKSSMFTFDYIFDQESTQLEVYEDAVVDMVDAALVGINATLLAYGQTGSGKTFSVLGDVKPNPLENDLLTSGSGMFLRVLSDLMDYKIRQAKKGWHIVIGLSCMEIYNENIRDLFGGKPNTPPPPLKAIMIGEEVLLPALIIKEMTSLQAVFNEIQLAISRRRSRATDANSSSSRSHCLFNIDILQQADTAPPPSLGILDQSKKGDERTARRTSTASPMSTKGKGAPSSAGAGGHVDPEKLADYEMPFQGTVFRLPGQREPIYASKIILADLAGSERSAITGVTGDGMAEATSINSSLTALGNVVHSLHEGSYVSYRVSNLTRLLKPTFSQPSSRVLLLAQCSPTQLTFNETISTLHFANKVKAMKVTTVTGAEAEKLQFDFLELEKIYDSLVGDLHIFELEMYAKSAVVRRKITQNDGLFYDAAVGKSGGKQRPMRERKAFVDGVGATAIAEGEWAAIQARQEEEKLQESQRQKQAIADERDAAVQGYKASLKETREAIKDQTSMRKHHAEQAMATRAAALSNQLIAEEEAAWASLMAHFMDEHLRVCQHEVSGNSGYYENLCKELNTMRLSVANSELPETAEDNRQYALSTWGHCVAKRFFSSCMEQREGQVDVLNYFRGNAALERWQRDNKEAIRKFAEESSADAM